jgi:formamidopyrimidine-DNA glycosylase
MKPEEIDMWPPKYWKFQLKTEDPAVEVAFTDPRRFGRVRLVNCPGGDIRKYSPLVENGPDPVVDTDIFTEDFLKEKMHSRHVPIKALLLDQAVISGIGNWVGDEVLFQAGLHPEQYCDDFSDEQIKKLYESIRHVCQFAVDKLGDSDQFPEDWLFHYRWSKGAKGGAHGHLPSGERLAFLTVGGRTSCYAPDRQKKSGRVVPGVKEELIESDPEESKPKKTAKSKVAKGEEGQAQTKTKRKAEEDEKPAKRSKAAPKQQLAARSKTSKTEKPVVESTEVDSGRRRSGRLQGKTG